MKNLHTIWQDFIGLRRVCGLICAVHWLLMIVLHLQQCRRCRNLLPADDAMGIGPFRVRAHGGKAKLQGKHVFSGLREIWVRDVYLGGGFLELPTEGTVVDLGANMGNFTNLALSHSPQVRVVAVEPGRTLNELFEASVGQNNWLSRTTLLRHFIGGTTQVQIEMLQDAQYYGASVISAHEFLQQNGIDEIAFLKCDIEGSEFDLLTQDSALLARSYQIAIELHDWAGDCQAFTKMLQAQGFQCRVVSSDAQGSIVLAKKDSLAAH